MLVIVMHNKKDYLKCLISLIRKGGINNALIIERGNIGINFIGEKAGFLFHRENLSRAYHKALIAILRDEKKVKYLLNIIENDDKLGLVNSGDKGFICAIPLRHIKHLIPEMLSDVKKEEEFEMKIGDYLKEDRISLNLKSSNKEESVKEISMLLKSAKEINDFEAFIGEVFEREKLNTTGIGNEIAIPHARTDAVKDFVIAFGRSKEGIEFNSLDGNPAKLIFLMGTPKHKGVRAYLKILAHLTRLLKKESFRNSLLTAYNSKEIIDIFKKAEDED